jgi:hypothetical protein
LLSVFLNIKSCRKITPIISTFMFTMTIAV